MTTKKHPTTMADKLREAIRASGKSANQIAKAAGVQQTSLSRFLRGLDMTMNRADKLVSYLGGELTFPAAVGLSRGVTTAGPRANALAVPAFRRADLPAGLKTKTDWRKEGRELLPDAKPAGKYRNVGGASTVYLYSTDATRPRTK